MNAMRTITVVVYYIIVTRVLLLLLLKITLFAESLPSIDQHRSRSREILVTVIRVRKKIQSFRFPTSRPRVDE